MVETVAVIVKTDFGIVVFGREAVAEEVGKQSCLGYGVAEGVVGILRYGVAVFVEVARDVAIVVVCGEVELAIARNCKETADAARAVKRVGEVKSPEVLDFRRIRCAAVDGVDGFVNQVPVVVHERARLDGVPSVVLYRR